MYMDDDTMITRLLRWMGCCLIVPIGILFLTWPLPLVLFLGYGWTVGYWSLGIWILTGVFGTIIYCQT